MGRKVNYEIRFDISLLCDVTHDASDVEGFPFCTGRWVSLTALCFCTLPTVKQGSFLNPHSGQTTTDHEDLACFAL